MIKLSTTDSTIISNLNGTNLFVSNVGGDYGRTIQQAPNKLHPSTIHQQIQQQQQQQTGHLQSNNQFTNNASSKPPLPNQNIYKEPMYLMYDDPNSNPTQNTQLNHLLLQQQQQQHKSAKNDENIYEEVDFMSLSSLRAQYADTLSLQSWTKKVFKKGEQYLLILVITLLLTKYTQYIDD